MSFLMSVEATFIERAKRVGVGLLEQAAATEAIIKPLQQSHISIDAAALARVVADAQCYPYFLQQWGAALWSRAMESSQPDESTTVTAANTDSANSPDRDTRAMALANELKKIGFIWQPPGESDVVPGIPSFMNYSLDRIKKLTAAKAQTLGADRLKAAVPENT